MNVYRFPKLLYLISSFFSCVFLCSFLFMFSFLFLYFLDLPTSKTPSGNQTLVHWRPGSTFSSGASTPGGGFTPSPSPSPRADHKSANGNGAGVLKKRRPRYTSLSAFPSGALPSGSQTPDPDWALKKPLLVTRAQTFVDKNSSWLKRFSVSSNASLPVEPNNLEVKEHHSHLRLKCT